jgi:uncharacterized protein
MVNKELVIKDFTETMKKHYGDRLAKIILYGSYARGDFNEESDIDFMVLLNDEEVRTSREILNIGDKLYDLSVSFLTMISAQVIPKFHFEKSNNLFYKNIKKDGQIVYG